MQVKHLNEWLLLQKLLSRNVPLYIVHHIDVHHIGPSNYGILSPVISNVYMDELSVFLNSSNIGVRGGGANADWEHFPEPFLLCR